RETEAGEDFRLPRWIDGDAGEALGERRRVIDARGDLGRLAGADLAAGLAATEVEDHARGELQPAFEESRIDAAFEAGAGIGGEAEGAAGLADTGRVEVCALDEDIGRVGLDAG